jgi:hypothetical protein
VVRRVAGEPPPQSISQRIEQGNRCFYPLALIYPLGVLSLFEKKKKEIFS